MKRGLVSAFRFYGLCKACSSLGIDLPHRGGYQQNHHSQSDEGPKLDVKTEVTKQSNTHASVKSRSLPLETFIEMLKDDVEVRSIRATLFQHFGDGASPKIKRFVKAMAGKLRQDGKTGAEVDALKRASGQEAHGGVKEAYAGTPASLRVPRNGVLVSGCQTNQTAGDKTTPRRTAFPTA
ncbi:hypothetical protein PR202_ga31558 [Eleusine coracana subsp. coracana]|uniref:Uncharacterized protein n=1 Tax=Eleusine coracana subsp. coracana TaxID=191504 RepID=A0AAV5DSW8_ELECO|nr:hypothetical protein PR202_ga31558 [Eleusine coracana subsp. coracana]